MSSLSLPLSLSEFRSALEPLPNASLLSERHRLLNSIHHLLRSNLQLLEFPDDPVCKEAVEENEGVIERQKKFIHCIKEELEKRGVSVTDHREEDEKEEEVVAEKVEANGVNGAAEEVTGVAEVVEEMPGVREVTQIGELEEEGEGRVNALLRGEGDAARVVQGQGPVTVGGQRVDLVVREEQREEDQGVYL
ncbi:hypothetical protein BJ508DRAFT_419081 [Ascobolus immersus RN42]|uniref:Uncharacterized protein n=1 Tax=Ascobolus immersus RN42 TaxID=1160509 RepID=A0A3N4HGZ6_ASCIM|nr:hypothetical protein BJ508DRAFT_419081 [Ascobolus immersus RN42]